MISQDSKYSDLLEMMVYRACRSLNDKSPYIVAYRFKKPFIDPNGPEPYRTILETDEELQEFVERFNHRVKFNPWSKEISLDPLNDFNFRTATITFPMMMNNWEYPDDENAGWPYFQVVCIPAAAFDTGHVDPAHPDILRGCYNAVQFPPHELNARRKAFEEARARAGASDIYVIPSPPRK